MRIAPQKNVVRGAVTVSLLVILIFLAKHYRIGDSTCKLTQHLHQIET